MNKLLIGFSVGLLTGILFAPAKGSETRGSIARKGNDLKDKFNELIDSVTDKFDSIAEDAEEIAAKGKQKVRAIKNELD